MCLEQFYRQVGQRTFDPQRSMYTTVNLSIAPADLGELRRIAALLGPADLFWYDRRIQSVDDIKSALDELGMVSPFKGNPELLDDTHLLYGVRNDHVHGMRPKRYDPHRLVRTVRAHVVGVLRQMPPMLAAFWLFGGTRAELRGDRKAAAR